MINLTRVCIFRIVMLKVNCLCLAGWTKILPKPPFAYSASFLFSLRISSPDAVYYHEARCQRACLSSIRRSEILASIRLIYPLTQPASSSHRLLRGGRDQHFSSRRGIFRSVRLIWLTKL